ncbi:MAG: hypothetical protein QM831_24390 [Kofleriaceae bacterium]
MAVVVHGLEPLKGETAFAFMALRLRAPVDRAGLIDVLRYVAPLIPEGFIEEFPDPLDGELKIVGVPWSPPEAGMAVDVQRRLIESADSVGVEAAWFFQTGTSLPSTIDEEDEEPDIDDEGTRVGIPRAATSTGERVRAPTSTGENFSLAAVSGEIGGGDRTDTAVSAIALDDETESDEEDDVVLAPGEIDQIVDDWSHGLPPQQTETRFPVDDYPRIIDQLDWEDFGIAFKLAGPLVPGESTVLLGFHTLWLAPYGGRYRNTAVTIDPQHHSAHLWVDRFAVPCAAEELVHHLMWIVARLDEVIPVLHARFVPASLAQKHSEVEDLFVLGGNPLLRVYRDGGESAVDAWITTQTDWSGDEVAMMLRELAVELVSGDEELVIIGDEEPDDDDDDDELPDDDDDDDEGDEGDDDDESEGSDDEDRGRHIARRAAELLKARAYAGALDPRAAEALVARLRKGSAVTTPVDTTPRKRPPTGEIVPMPVTYAGPATKAIVEVLGAARWKPAVSVLIQILEQSIDDELVAATARALGAIGDPRAVPALVDVAAAAGTFVAKPAAALALAACVGKDKALPDDELHDALGAIIDAGEGALDPPTTFAVGKVARLLPPHRRAEVRRRLQEQDPPAPEPEALLARAVALQLASPAVPAPAMPAEARGYAERALLAQSTLALEIVATVPELADLETILPLTCVGDPAIRNAAHAVLVKLGHPAPLAPVFDATAAHRLDDTELMRRIEGTHVIGRDALVTELGRRKLPAARSAIVAACHGVLGSKMFEHDRRLLEAALPILARTPDAEVGAVVDRMAQHQNVVVQKLAKKWHHLRHDDEEIN